MNNFFVIIGGFVIKISFAKVKVVDPTLDYIRNRMEMDLFIYLKEFIVFEHKGNIDFEIEFNDLSEVEIILFKNKSKGFTPLYEFKSNKKIVTYPNISIYQFERIFKNIILTLIRNGKGFGIHASAAVINGKACLFLGDSGAGKSTIVELIHNQYKALNDDIVLLKKVSNKYFVFQTPFFEKAWWIYKSKNTYEVDKLFFIHKSKEFYIDKLKDKSLITELIISQIIAAHGKDEKIFKEVFTFINSFKNYFALGFDKDEKKLLKLIRSMKE